MEVFTKVDKLLVEDALEFTNYTASHPRKPYFRIKVLK
jgi:hypothetical protein